MHKPVLLNEVIRLLDLKTGGTYVDGTVGGAGFMEAILQDQAGVGHVLGIDRDGDAIDRARTRLAKWGDRCSLVRGNHSNIDEIVTGQGMTSVDGVVLDLGVSSDQIDTPARGFSFNGDGPLDMRMDRSAPTTAADVVNSFQADELSDVLFQLGEERKSRRIARAIVWERDKSPIETTGRLAEIVARAAGGRRGRLHPATRTFQALRMLVNEEIPSLKKGLESSLGIIKTGGRMAVISFHSIEDREVKRCFVRHVAKWESCHEGGSKRTGDLPEVTLLNRKVIRPSEEELADNPRARSAKLRGIELKAHEIAA